MHLNVIQSRQDKVNLGTTSVGSTISPWFGISEAAHESENLWVSPEELGICPRRVFRLQGCNVLFFFSSCQHTKAFFKNSYQKKLVNLSHTAFTGLQTWILPQGLQEHKFNTEQMQEKTADQVLWRTACRFIGPRTSLAPVAPMTSTTSGSEYFLLHMLRSFLHSPSKVHQLLYFPR